MIGLSGGPDSVCLFSVLKELSEELDFALYAVHVNHGFRPGDAEQDQTYVEKLCEKNGIACIPFVYDCNAIAKEQGLSSEEAGRQVRYASFRKVAGALIRNGIPEEKVKIAVAQNADDQAETVLLRLLRGTGPDGLAGMAYSRMEQNICVIRPLLDTWRHEIEAYCRDNDLQPRTDKTNLQPIYTRNKVRLQLIPYLEENFNPNIMEALNRLSRIAGEDKAYLWQQAEEAYERIKAGDGKLDQKGLRELPQPVRYRVIMKAFQQAGLEQDITAAHLEQADRILEAAGESKEAAFPGGYRLIVRYGEAVFVKPAENEQTARLSVRIADMSAEAIPAGAAVFDYDKIKAAFGDIACNADGSAADQAGSGAGIGPRIELRTRREGDYLPVKNGRKKLQDYFIDEKVPKENRDSVKFAAFGSEILWIMTQSEQGIMKNRYNPKYKLDMDTKKALILELVCEM